MSTTTEGVVSSKELLEAQSHLWSHTFAFINSFSLKCAIELGIPDKVYNHGKPITLTVLATALSIPPVRVPSFQRFMRLLVHSGFFTVTTTQNDGEDIYALTTNSIPFVKEKGTHIKPFIEMVLDEMYLSAWPSLSTWFRSEIPPTPFELAHGMSVWDAMATMPEFGRTMREGMDSDSAAVAEVIIADSAHLLQGVNTLVEVVGGTGTMMLVIAEKFSSIKCTVFDLPPRITAMDKNDKLEYIAGDMFERIPSADVVIFKWVLMCWTDEQCVTILKRCKEAIPSKENGGKVIILDKVIDTDVVNHKVTETQLHFDMQMLVHTGGKQRTEAEWNKLFIEAGFKEYEILPALGLRSIIVLYH